MDSNSDTHRDVHVSFGSEEDAVYLLELVRFGAVNGHGPVKEFANKIANQLRNIAWHGTSQIRIVVLEMPNKRTPLATKRHRPA